jgi:hypothetical protein
MSTVTRQSLSNVTLKFFANDRRRNVSSSPFVGPSELTLRELVGKFPSRMGGAHL